MKRAVEECAALDGKNYWNCWTRSRNRDGRDGYCIHAFCEQDYSGKTLCGARVEDGGWLAFPHDDPHPSCLKCRKVMVKRGAILTLSSTVIVNAPYTAAECDYP